jgi:hypothetical protein
MLLNDKSMYLHTVIYSVNAFSMCFRVGVYSYARQFTNSVLHVVRVFTAYLLMLCGMTYNIWLLVAVGLGSGIGIFLVRPIVSVMIRRHLDKAETASNGSHTENGRVKAEQTERMLTGNDGDTLLPSCHKSGGREINKHTDAKLVPMDSSTQKIAFLDRGLDDAEPLVENKSKCEHITSIAIQPVRVSTL